jgi:hypothetical protein
MSYTSQLKSQVDLPVWEWMRFAPVNTAGNSATCRDDRYMYYHVGSVFYRYDTYSDGWQQLATPIIGTATVSSLFYSKQSGHYGRAISSGGGNNTIQMAALNGHCMIGYKIRILSGTGAGQERTITAVADPIVAEHGVAAGNFTDRFQDSGSTGPATKAWRFNQWRDYQGRTEFGIAPGTTRKILINTTAAAVFADSYYAGTVHNWGALGSTVSANSYFRFESQVVTVNSNWTTNPDSSSEFVIMSGGIYMVSSNSASTWLTTQYYDVLADVWFQKTSNGTILSAALGTEIDLIGFNEDGGAIATGTATSGGSKSLTNSALNLATDTYANFQIRIVGGTGRGQTRTILYNTESSIYVTRAWDTNPSSDSVYQIWPDTDKLYLVGNGGSCIFQYSIENDQWSTGRQYEAGFIRSGAATSSNGESFAIASITKATGGITVLNPTPPNAGTGYLVNQLLTLGGGASGVARITAVNPANGAVTSVILESCGTGYTTGSTYSTTPNTIGGTGCTLQVTTAAEVATVTFATNIPCNFKIGENVTISGASAANYNGVKTVLAGGISGNGPFNSTIQYAAPADAAPTFVATTGTMMVDSTKNWVVNEHVGKIIQFTSSNSPSAAGFARKITSNTANTISWTQNAGTLAVFARYAIIDEKCFATDMSVGARIAGGRSGVATNGTTTTLVDSTKNWPINYWSNTLPAGASNTARKVRIIAGTGAGAELTILYNSANTLTFSTQSFTPDATTLYQILDGHGQATGGSSTTLIDTTQNWGTNVHVNKRVKFVAGDAQSVEATITANTQTTLTFGATSTVSASTAYSILEPAPRGSGGSADVITGSASVSDNNRTAVLWRGGGSAEVGHYNFNSMQYEALTTAPFTEALTTGSMYAYDGADRVYFHSNTTGRIMYYDVTKNTITNSGVIPYGMGGAIVGNRMEIFTTVDGLKYLYIMRHSSNEMWRTLLFN